ncbi:MAG: undecaprenyl-diphosphate phosphatase [Alphaproteobacteria bacterium]|nr:undecaprenyl-diphosphate phosphatase [Alphaproteobacteria bacterium]
MALYHILILAVVQGITEFLPISSSGHLILTSQVLGWPDQGMMIDIAVHVGTLFAVMLYFWRDMWLIAVGVVRLAAGRSNPGARLALYIAIGTVPIVIVGFLGKDFIATHFRSAEIIAWATLGFGIILWIADRVGMTLRKIEHLSWGSVLFIGLMQVLALIPGTSRSGITMTAARVLGMERQEAARFSMLLSIPTILGAGIISSYDLYESGDMALGLDALIAAAIAFLTAMIAIWGLMRWLRNASFTPFVLYRIILAAGLLYWVYA